MDDVNAEHQLLARQLWGSDWFAALGVAALAIERLLTDGAGEDGEATGPMLLTTSRTGPVAPGYPLGGGPGGARAYSHGGHSSSWPTIRLAPPTACAGLLRHVR
jgi:hypothetical protein